MRYRCIILAAFFAVLLLYSSVVASPITADKAKNAVTGWLVASPKPFDTDSERKVTNVDSFTDESGAPAYHIVYLEPSGFVIVSADDLIEPIIGFADSGDYDPSLRGPLVRLVTQDLGGRTSDTRGDTGSTASLEHLESNQARKKWKYFIDLASESGGNPKLESESAICDSYLSDTRVAPLIQTKWGQSWYYGLGYRKIACFNYYTPQLINNEIAFIEGDIDNYPAGCLAITMAQLMRYHKFPDYPIEPADFNIVVDWKTAKRGLLRGHGPDGEYNWDDMVFEPIASTTGEQRRAIGTICHDAGIAINTQYTTEGSGAYMYDALIAMAETFGYPQAIWGANEGNNIDSQYMLNILNPNLDANCPVILGILDGIESSRGHAVVCDGYGYDNSTMYHHLNIGWYGIDDCWYNLPNIACPNAGTYSVIPECLYNVFPDCTGEIISGRITDTDGKPIKNAVVTAKKESNGQLYTTTTNNKGIYAFKGLPHHSSYTITADKGGYDFELIEAQTGKSHNGETDTGNKWGVDLTGYDNCVTVAIGTGTSSWDHPLHTYFHDSRTQVIYLADEIGTAGTITSLALNVMSAPTETIENWTIRMKHTTLSEYTTSMLDSEGWNIVYQNDQTMDTGWQRFVLQNTFDYDGTSNLLVDFSHDNSSYADSGLCEATNSGSKRSVYAFSDSMHGDPLDWNTENSPKLNRSVMVPNIKLKVGGESQIVSGGNQVVSGESQIVYQKTKLITSDGRAGNSFGCSVSISGDYAIVGAYDEDEESGAAYIFKNDGTNWIQQAKLTTPYMSNDDNNFGFSVSISGDYAIVGAGTDNSFVRDVGAAYIFKREDNNWTFQKGLFAEDVYSLGRSVSINGNYAITGTKASACIFKSDGMDWSQQARLTDLERFVEYKNIFPSDGDFVSIYGDYAIVGAELEWSGQTNSGLAVVLHRENSQWIEQAQLIPSDASSSDFFGWSASMNSDYALIGAPGDGDNGNDSGSAYIFKREDTNWAQQAKLIASDGQDSDYFGRSVNICGDYAAIGAPCTDDENIGSDHGCVYIFKLDGQSWTQQEKITALDISAGDNFGCSVSMDGNYIIVGAEKDDDNGFDSGSAYIYMIDDTSDT